MMSVLSATAAENHIKLLTGIAGHGKHRPLSKENASTESRINVELIPPTATRVGRFKVEGRGWRDVLDLAELPAVGDEESMRLSPSMELTTSFM